MLRRRGHEFPLDGCGGAAHAQAVLAIALDEAQGHMRSHDHGPP
jgi:hypothetical protein